MFLMAFQEANGDIGTCSFHHYVYKTRLSCEIPFYQGLRLGSIMNCRDDFESLISCITNVTRVCEHSWRSDAWIDMDVRLKFRKQFYCQNGALILPLALCGRRYYEEGPQCVRRFHRKFRNNITDPTLCMEFSKAKTCVQELFEEECPGKKKSPSLFMNVLFDGYNPFCRNITYQPPTTATTPSRKTRKVSVTTKQRKQIEKYVVTEMIITNDATRKQLSSSAIFKHVIVLVLLLVI